MNDDRLMIFPELTQCEFDFDTMIDAKGYATITNIPVYIDRIIRDLTKTTVIGVSGTMVVHGTKIRGVWDVYGNVIECKNILSIFSPKSWIVNVDRIFENTSSNMFRLVHITELKNK